MKGGRVNLSDDAHAYVIDNIQREDKALEQTQQKEKQIHKQQEEQEKQNRHDEQERAQIQKEKEREDHKYDIILKNLYYKELNFDGIDELFRKAKIKHKDITRDQVSQWLKSKRYTNKR